MLEVIRVQIETLNIEGVNCRELTSATRLVEELGIDSLRFIDLTVLLEDALEIDEFPMQAWVDAQIESGRHLSLGALAEACVEVLRANGR
jgi:acyl carrier protein